MRLSLLIGRVAVVISVVTVGACSSQGADNASTEAPPVSSVAATLTPPDEGAPLPATKSPYDGLPDGLQAIMDRPFTGDFPEMV